MTVSADDTREGHRFDLAVARENAGIHILPLGHFSQDAVTVSADDTRDGHRFDLAVARNRALEAFHHPFAYAAAHSDGAL